MLPAIIDSKPPLTRCCIITHDLTSCRSRGQKETSDRPDVAKTQHAIVPMLLRTREDEGSTPTATILRITQSVGNKKGRAIARPAVSLHVR